MGERGDVVIFERRLLDGADRRLVQLDSEARATFDKHVVALRALGGRTLFLGSNLGLAPRSTRPCWRCSGATCSACSRARRCGEAEGYPLGSYFEHLEAVKPVVEGSIGATSRELRHGAFIAALPHVARRAALLTLPSPGPRLRGGE